MTPADIGSAIQRAAAAEFTDARSGEDERRLTTEDVAAALEAAVPTISAEDRRTFADEASRYGRS